MSYVQQIIEHKCGGPFRPSARMLYAICYDYDCYCCSENDTAITDRNTKSLERVIPYYSLRNLLSSFMYYDTKDRR